MHECGFVHSNISSFCILIRRLPSFSAKLSCFELATEVECSDEFKKDIQNTYKEDNYVLPDDMNKLSEYVLLLRNSQKNLKDKYRYQSQERSRARDYHDEYESCDFSKVQRTHLAYNTNYRRKFSLHNYQAPEILKSQEAFVFPSKLSDVYSISLLLWEILNNSIPYVIFNAIELEKLYTSRKIQLTNNLLPSVEQHRCYYFDKLLNFGLQVIPVKRINLRHFTLLLDNIKNDLNSVGLYNDNDDFFRRVATPKKENNSEVVEYSNIELPATKNVENNVIYDKTKHNYLSNSNLIGK